ncbi:MAG: MFS transporter [Hyphomicrobiales bacterium]
MLIKQKYLALLRFNLNAIRSSRTGVFLVVSFLSFVSSTFIEEGIKFAAFDLTQSKTVVSMLRPFSSVSYIVFFTFIGIIVDMISRKFFLYLHLIGLSILSLSLFLMYKSGYATILLLAVFVIVHVLSSSLFQSARNAIFYDLCGADNLATWISRRAMVRNGAELAGFLVLSFFVFDSALLFAIYPIILLSALPVFWVIGYEDRNRKRKFSSFGEGVTFVGAQLREFVAVCRRNNTLLSLFAFSFGKTMFIFWPMAVGALLKFGIETAATRRVYLIAMVAMSIVSIVSSYALGKLKESFTIRSFVIGAGVSGLGIFLLSLTHNTIASTAMLAIMYVGLAISGLSASYILRAELPEDHRTQGLGFSVVPYYTADMVSGSIFALLLQFFSVDRLLFWDGVVLILVCAMTLLVMKPSKPAGADFSVG